MHREDLLRLFNNNAQLLSNWHITLEKLILKQMERERDVLSANPAKRYARVLKPNPKLFQEISHKYIASSMPDSRDALQDP